MKNLNNGFRRLLVLAALLIAGNLPFSVVRSQTVISIVDDFTGGEARGMLTVETAPALEKLLPLAGACGLDLHYHVIQETVADPVSVKLVGWNPELEPQPSRALPYAQFLAASKAYDEKLNRLHQKKLDWILTSRKGLQTFTVESVEARQIIERRWLAETAIRGDFRRSSIEGAMIAAANASRTGEEGGGADFRAIIVSSDGVDAPSNGVPRTTALTPEEIPPTIFIVFVSDTGTRPDSVLFSSLRSDAPVARTLDEAVGLIIGHVSAQPEKSNHTTTQKP